MLNDLLTQAEPVLDKKKNGLLRLGVVAVGSDGYSVLIAGGEIALIFGYIQVLVAYAVNGNHSPAMVLHAWSFPEIKRWAALSPISRNCKPSPLDRNNDGM